LAKEKELKGILYHFDPKYELCSATQRSNNQFSTEGKTGSM
jgi:hypothetical protein